MATVRCIESARGAATHGVGKRLTLNHDPGFGNLGRGYHLNDESLVDVTRYSMEHVRVVLRSDGKDGYQVTECHPLPERTIHT